MGDEEKDPPKPAVELDVIPPPPPNREKEEDGEPKQWEPPVGLPPPRG